MPDVLRLLFFLLFSLSAIDQMILKASKFNLYFRKLFGEEASKMKVLHIAFNCFPSAEAWHNYLVWNWVKQH